MTVATAVSERRRSLEAMAVVNPRKRKASGWGELGQPLSESVTSQEAI